MATTPNFGIPLVAGTDTAKLNDLLNAQATALDTNVQVKLDEINTELDPLTGDTGWVNITTGFDSGFTTGSTPGQLQYRIKNGWVSWRGGANGAFPTGGYTQFVSALPAAARPSVLIRVGGGSSGGNPIFVEIHPDGRMVAAHNSGSTRVWVAFSTSYPQS